MCTIFMLPASVLLFGLSSLTSSAVNATRRHKNSGRGGYKHIMNDYMLARDQSVGDQQDHGVRVLNVQPYSTRHAILFTTHTEDRRVRLALSSLGETTQEVVFEQKILGTF